MIILKSHSSGFLFLIDTERKQWKFVCCINRNYGLGWIGQSVMKKIESHITFFMKPKAKMSNYKCHDIFTIVTNDKYVYFIACGMAVLKKPTILEYFIVQKKGRLAYN
jgi:hypothetical protein